MPLPPFPAPVTGADYAHIATALGADLVRVLGDRHGKTVLSLRWPDRCTTLALVMDQGDGRVRVWPEVDLGRIEFSRAVLRHDLYWFVDPDDLPSGPGCREHASAHWRAQHALLRLGAAA